MLMSEPESKALSITMEENIPTISNIKRKLQVFEKRQTPVSLNSSLRVLNITPSGMASVKSRLRAFEVLRTTSPENMRRSKSMNIVSNIPSLKSRIKALQGFEKAISNDVHLLKGATDFENKTLTVFSGIDNGMVHPQSIKQPMMSVAERYSRCIAGDQIVMGDYVTGVNAPTNVGFNGGGQKASITTIKNGSVKNMIDFFHTK